MTQQPVSYPRHRFPSEIISHAVWLYHVFSLSLRDVELILAERGVAVTHESIRHWCRKFGADFARRLRRRRPRPGDTWHLDEVSSVSVAGIANLTDVGTDLSLIIGCSKDHAAGWAQVSCRQTRNALARAFR